MTNMNQNGRSMIEMLGVLAIIGVLSVGGIAGYSKAMLKYKTNKTIDQITMLTTNIRTLYAQQKDFDGLENSTAISMGVVPDEMIVDGALTNPFSGTVIVEKSNSLSTTAGEGRAFIIEVNGIPREACMAIATSDWGSNYSSGLIGMAVAGEPAASLGPSLLDYIFSPAYAETTTPPPSSLKRAGADLSAIYAGTCTSAAGKVCAKNMPMDVATASTYCSSDSNNSVAFKYY